MGCELEVAGVARPCLGSRACDGRHSVETQTRYCAVTRRFGFRAGRTRRHLITQTLKPEDSIA
jgi:hypothetical protein